MTIHKSKLLFAEEIVQQASSSMTPQAFVCSFIDHWAFMQTRLYRPEEPLPEPLKPLATSLAKQLEGLMFEYPGEDVLGGFFCQSGLTDTSTPPVEPYQPTTHVYFQDKNAGTGASAMKWIIAKYTVGGKELIAECALALETTTVAQCKAAMIQVVRLFNNLKCMPRAITIRAIDPVTGDFLGPAYALRVPKKAD
jgi:hypothetical protein